MIDHAEIVQEVSKKRGQMEDRLLLKATYNPKTKKYFAFSDNYVARPGELPERISGARPGLKPTSWDNVLKAASEAPGRWAARSVSACRTRSTRTWP